MSQQDRSLLSSFRSLFFICKIFGIYPHSLSHFRKDCSLVASKKGKIGVIISMVILFALYNLLIYFFTEEDRILKSKQSTLTFVIGVFLNYIGPAMIIVDQLSAILNQDKVTQLFNRIKNVDSRLLNENIYIDNSLIKKRITIMLFLTFTSELIIMIATVVVLIEKEWISILWIVACIPTLFSTLDKIWFASILFGLKQRFHAINNSLDFIVDEHRRLQNFKEISDKFNLGYLHKEILFNQNTNSKLLNDKKNIIFPIDDNDLQSSIKSSGLKNKSAKIEKPKTSEILESELGNIGKMEIKLNNFCQLHDEICEIGKALNELWSYPILILMAYGFLIFTSQLYFLYCGTQGQTIPSLFRSAKSPFITAIILIYTSGKCVYLIYLSWKTSLESKRTGICLHKIGVAADNNVLYEIVNHLSLKLLNHSVDFSACGFFSLDMETLYGVTGGITSYLIILIQFNLAAQQAKDAIHANFQSTNNGTDLSGLLDDSVTLSPKQMAQAAKSIKSVFGSLMPSDQIVSTDESSYDFDLTTTDFNFDYNSTDF